MCFEDIEDMFYDMFLKRREAEMYRSECYGFDEMESMRYWDDNMRAHLLDEEANEIRENIKKLLEVK